MDAGPQVGLKFSLIPGSILYLVVVASLIEIVDLLGKIPELVDTSYHVICRSAGVILVRKSLFHPLPKGHKYSQWYFR